MKKKLTLVATSVLLVAALVIGGTLAYFTDTDNATNTFTVGNVKISLIEQQRGTKDGETALVDFEQGKLLMPIVGSAQGEKETVGGYNLPTAENYVDKIVNVKNTGTQPAYVRVLFAFPADMDDAQSAGEMMLHWNSLGETPANTWSQVDCGVQVTLDGKAYNIYSYTYLSVLNAGTTTAWPAISGVYLDERVNVTVGKDDSTVFTMVNGRGETKTATYAKGTAPKLYVIAQAVQSAGFTSAGSALQEGFGAVDATNANKWFSAVTTTTSDAED